MFEAGGIGVEINPLTKIHGRMVRKRSIEYTTRRGPRERAGDGGYKCWAHVSLSFCYLARIGNISG
jgi:hypothetical protein